MNERRKGHTGFRQDLERLINKHCRERGSDTPDFILGDYLVACLKAFDTAVRERERWYERAPDEAPQAVDEAPTEKRGMEPINHGRDDDKQR